MSQRPRVIRPQWCTPRTHHCTGRGRSSKESKWLKSNGAQKKTKWRHALTVMATRTRREIRGQSRRQSEANDCNDWRRELKSRRNSAAAPLHSTALYCSSDDLSLSLSLSRPIHLRAHSLTHASVLCSDSVF